MGREVRLVPKDWQHPKDAGGRYIPLRGGSYAAIAKEFLAKANTEGLQEAVDYCGCPDKDGYMPEWPDAERTHLMMYEDTSEGTPISPAFETPEDLARWLTENGASACGKQTATYEGWLRVAKGGYAMSGMYTPKTGMVNGVDALTPGFFEDKK